MEHRQFERIAIDLNLLIFQRGLPVATGRLRDASLQGLFIETAYHELRTHQHLQFEFCADGGTSRCRHRVTARVVRHAADGAALELDEDDQTSCGAIGALVNGRRALAGRAL